MNWEVCSHLKSPWGTHASVAFPFVCDCAICVFAAMPLLPGPRGEKERPNLLGDWTNSRREACNLLGRMSPLSLLSPLPLHCCFIRNVFFPVFPIGTAMSSTLSSANYQNRIYDSLTQIMFPLTISAEILRNNGLLTSQKNPYITLWNAPAKLPNKVYRRAN